MDRRRRWLSIVTSQMFYINILYVFYISLLLQCVRTDGMVWVVSSNVGGAGMGWPVITRLDGV